MFLVLGEVLDHYEVAALREAAGELDFQDGRATAGKYAKPVKHNEQAAASPALDAITEKVKTTLTKNRLFKAAARPRRFVRLLVSRYSPGMEYGLHVDDAIMDGQRTDLSFTLFLSPSDAYSGGGLVIDDPLEARTIRLEAGEMVLYPSNTLHRVEPVTQGERLAVVGWVASWVRDPQRREILFDLEMTASELFAREGKSSTIDRLNKARTNLLRMWADD
ncbi:Fe2+-dependent dioxygenase [Dichotomicrobium thermohalophilum]|uniref:PKHD-type hydroxylase n=1 Tax=Dichotomicrobium thermohalophilum TaxID=933063 RepID=A0A397Q0X0_9HYPH|nr:Fe2+-dependent dioxygenase [Dichotomicrobium thermohalophilum]RIA55046.1 PKHD-type hydroxylase [Dichotomicrobium thermohalophilum]